MPAGSRNIQENNGFSTRSVRTAEKKFSAFGATVVPIVQSSAFGYEDVEGWLKVALKENDGYIYTRNTNPTVRAFEEKLMALEGAEDAVSFSSGMAAITSTLLGLMKSGDRVVSVKDLYGGTFLFITQFLPRYGIKATICNTTDFDSIEKEIINGADIVYLESPTNPTLKIIDLSRFIKAAHRIGAIAVVDNTFATPINQNPIGLGADIVIHSATKFLGGHGDVMGGIACGKRKLISEIFHFKEIAGPCLDPHAAFLLMRGMKTLELRVKHQNATAQTIAEFLSERKEIQQVFYPGLKSHPYHRIARKQMRGFGGVLSFEVKGGVKAASRLIENLKIVSRAANLGAVETLAGLPSTTSHVECTPEERLMAGIPEGLVRYSVGIENLEDLLNDLTQALQKARIT